MIAANSVEPFTPEEFCRLMLETINLDCVRGGRALFRNLSLTLTSGTLLQVQGPNGSGKTSLLRIICGLMSPENGEVRWQGANIRTLGEDYAEAITYLAHRNGIKDELTPLENLRITSGVSGDDLSREQAQLALKSVGLDGRGDLPTRFLSEGQKRRTALARLVTRDSPLWILDEVMSSLDAAAVQLVTSLLDEHLQQGGMAVVATHQELQISAGSLQRLELGNGDPGSAAPLGRPS